MGTSYDGALYAKYRENCDLFLETGSYIGDGIQGALNVGYPKIISIELAKCQYDFCIDRFQGIENVNIILGDSRQLLPQILDEYGSKRVFFWLDAHCSGGATEGDLIDITLPQELEIVIKYIIEKDITAVLAMDDVKPEMEEFITNKLKDYPSTFLGKEPCINPYTDLTETDRSIIIFKLNEKLL